MSLRFRYLVERNFLVWRKLMVASLLGNLADPLIYLLGLGYGFGMMIGTVNGRPYINFLAAGMVCYSTMQSATFEGLYSAFSRLKMQRTWEGLLYAPMTARDIVVGEWVWAAAKALLSGASILVVMYGLGIVHGWRPLAALPISLLVGLAFAGVALVMTTLAKSYDFFVYYFTLVITPLMFLSGVFYPLAQLPRALQAAAWFLPLAHACSLMRAVTLGDPLGAPATLSVLLLIAYGVGGVAIASAIAERRLTR
jgi:lipooligosaccharide transport system permease protein